jgi:hypothetical protein
LQIKKKKPQKKRDVPKSSRDKPSTPDLMPPSNTVSAPPFNFFVSLQRWEEGVVNVLLSPRPTNRTQRAEKENLS